MMTMFKNLSFGKGEKMQALLVTAYKSEEQLIELLSSAYDRFRIYVHIDKKSNIDPQRILMLFPGIKIIKLYDVNWGGLNHLRAIIELLRMGVDDRITYFHIISGQDIIVRNLDDFNFFNGNEKIYMSFIGEDNFSNEILKRLHYWSISANSVMRNPYKGKINKIINRTQDIFKIYRTSIGNFKAVYKGVVWCSFPLDAAEYVLTYCNENRNLKSFDHIHIPEEFFFQTVLGNSRFKNRIVADNMRYSDWHYRNGSCPAFLDETDYKDIVESGKFFARKVDRVTSQELIKMIAEHIR